MIAINVKKGEKYAVTSSVGCTLTYEKDGQMKPLCTAMAGVQAYFVAPSGLIYSDDDSVDITLFNGALAALFLLGEGNTLPSGYTRLEYLEATGTQFLDIPRMWKQADSFRVEFISTLASPNENVFGATDAYRLMNGSFYLRVFRAGKYYDFTKTVQGAKNLVTIDAQKITANGQEQAVQAEAWGNTAENYKIFTNNTLYYKGQFRLLYFEHLSDTNMKLIPALDETGAPCMYDTVSRTPVYNAGTGDFVTPPTGAATYGLRRILPDWGKLTENGLRRLYHAPAGYKGDIYEYALANGFKPIFEIECPTEGYWVPEWVENAEQIELVWKRTEPPAEDDLLTEA